MIYDLIKDLKNRIESETGFNAVLLTNTPTNYELQTAYIMFPPDYTAEYMISGDAKVTFTVPIMFITHSCEADRIDTLYNNIELSMNQVSSIVANCIDRIKSYYHDDNLDVACREYHMNSKQWQVANKILIATSLNLAYNGYSKVRDNLNTSNT